jgi:predicted ATPase
VSQLHQRTGSNPLFVVNVVQDWITQGVLVEVDGHWELGRTVEDAARGVPPSIRQLIERQLTRLAAPDQRLLEAASVAGEEFSAALVAAELAEDAEDVEDRFAALMARHVLRPRGTAEWPDGTVAGRYAFAHALYQEVLSERVPAGRRVQLHRWIGRRLERPSPRRPRTSRPSWPRTSSAGGSMGGRSRTWSKRRAKCCGGALLSRRLAISSGHSRCWVRSPTPRSGPGRS